MAAETTTDVHLVNRPSDKDAIKSTTLNLTKATTAGAGVIGLVTALFGDDLASLTHGQQTAIVIALIGAVAIVRGCDLLARAMAPARAVTVKNVAGKQPAAAPNGQPGPQPTAADVAEGQYLLLRNDRGVFALLGVVRPN